MSEKEGTPKAENIELILWRFFLRLASRATCRLFLTSVLLVKGELGGLLITHLCSGCETLHSSFSCCFRPRAWSCISRLQEKKIRILHQDVERVSLSDIAYYNRLASTRSREFSHGRGFSHHSRRLVFVVRWAGSEIGLTLKLCLGSSFESAVVLSE